MRCYIVIFISILVFFSTGWRVVFAQQAYISATRLISWLDSVNRPIVLDVRGRSSYRAGTIPGALDGGIDPEGFVPDSSRDPIVLIVEKDADPDFINSWIKRLNNNHHQVWILENGISSWIESGGLIDKPEVSYSKPGAIPFHIPKGLCEGGEPAQVFE